MKGRGRGGSADILELRRHRLRTFSQMLSVRNRTGATLARGAARVLGSCWRRRRRSACIGDNGGLLTPTPPPCCSRPLHCSAVCCSKTGKLLAKFLSKKKKKFWYDSPTLISQLAPKPSDLAGVIKLSPPKFRKEDSIHKRTLDVLLFKAVEDVLNTCEVSEEVYDLRVELSKASLTSDFSTCRLYWRTTGSAEQDEYVGRLLNKSAARIRSILISHQVLTNVPFLLFVQDREDATIKEIERLLAIADFGPEEDNEAVESNISEQRSTTDTCLDSSHTPIHSNLFGIDHDVLNMKITEYKKMKKDTKIEGIGLSEQQKQQLAEIRKQKKMKRKKTKKIPDDELTPWKYLMDKYNEDYSDGEMTSSEEDPLHYCADELEDDLEVEDKDNNYK